MVGVTWQDNILNYLLVFLVLGGLFLIIWCRIKGQSISEFIRDLREAMSPMED